MVIAATLPTIQRKRRIVPGIRRRESAHALRRARRGLLCRYVAESCWPSGTGTVKVPLSPLLHTAAARAGLRVSVKVLEGESFAVRPAVRREESSQKGGVGRFFCQET